MSPSTLALLPLLALVACGEQGAETPPFVGTWILIASDGHIADVISRPSDAPLVGPVPIGEVRALLFPAPASTLKVSERAATSSLRYLSGPCDLELEGAGSVATLIPGEPCAVQWTHFQGGSIRVDRQFLAFLPSSLTLAIDSSGRMLEEAAGPCRLDLRTEESGLVVVDQTFDCTLARSFTWERTETMP